MNLELLQNRTEGYKTPFYAYDLGVLHNCINACNAAKPDNFHVHYALKANTQEKIINALSANGFGADCVSYNEVQHALDNGFKADKVVFAGVGKTDDEINAALKQNIFCFNVESYQELEVIDELAAAQNKMAGIALRLNPNVKADTHKYITTGLNQNKFGIDEKEIPKAIKLLKASKNLRFEGIHFHIGSQIVDLENFKQLCLRANVFYKHFADNGLNCNIVNVGGGFGIDYLNPLDNPYPDFKSFFNVYEQFLELPPNVEVHFELGRALVGNCGALITQVLYEKNNGGADFLIVDAGMTELMRPALYNAFHKIVNVNKQYESENTSYIVAGPICESSDVFSKNCVLPKSKRGDMLAILSAGAYGEVMRSKYNLRTEFKALFI